MKANKVLSVVLLWMNLAGVLCLIYFAIPYLTHDTQVPYPDAMLNWEKWDISAMILTVGAVPLFIANLLGFLLVRVKHSLVRLLFFLPSAVCVAIVAHYWIPALITSNYWIPALIKSV